jgi:proteasome alpha subunit
MMLDEPYRWAESVANRREYLEDQLRGGSPVVGVPYDDGALLLTVGRGGRKVFEVYDRAAFSAIGHPADIERLRLAAIDMAHLDGFTNASSDVSLQRLVNFGIAPLVKGAFDEMFRAPYTVRTLMAEIGPARGVSFFTVEYDGSFERWEGSAAIAGTGRAAEAMRAHLERAGTDGRGLTDALDLALRAWAVGRRAARVEGEGKEVDEGTEPGDPEIGETLREECRTHAVEAAVLERSRPGRSKFRRVDDEALTAAVSRYR